MSEVQQPEGWPSRRSLGCGHRTSGETFKSQPVGFVVKKRQLGKRLIEENVPTGELEAYLCASCGYFETYVKHAETIPFDELDGFSWLNPAIGEEGPYR